MKNLYKKIIANSLAVNSAIVFAGSMVSNVGAYLYHLVVGRILGPSGYGELSSLISLLYILGVPTIVLQTVLVKYFSTCKAKNSPGQAKYLFRKMLKTIVIILIPVVIILCLISPFIAGFLNLSGSRVVLWVFFVFAISTLTALNSSVIQGFQLFLWFSVLTAGGTLLKLFVSIPFAYYGVEMTMIATFLIITAVYVLYFIPIRFMFRSKEENMDITKKDFVRYSLPSFLTLLGMTSLYSIDIVLAKHYLPSFDAGIYSSVAVLGKIIFYASAAIGTVLFPIIAERYAKRKETFAIIKLAVILVAIVSLGVTMVYTIFPISVVHLLFGTSFDRAASYLGIFAVFITIYSIVNIIVLSCLAIEKMHVYIFTCIAALLQIVLISLYHESLSSIIYINIGVASALLIGVGGYYLYGKNQHHHSGI